MSNTSIIPVNELRVELDKLTRLIFGQSCLQITKRMLSILVTIQYLTNLLVQGKISEVERYFRAFPVRNLQHKNHKGGL